MNTKIFGLVFLKDSGKILHILESKSLDKMLTMVNPEEDVLQSLSQIDISKYKVDVESKTLVALPEKEIDYTKIPPPEEREKRDKRLREKTSFPLDKRLDSIIRCLQLADIKNPTLKEINELTVLKEALFKTII